MASQESGKGSVKSPTIDKVDAIAEESITDEKKLPSTSSVEQQNGLSDVGNPEEKKNLTLDVTDEANSGNKQKKNTDNIEKENKHNLNSLAIDKSEQDDNKVDKKQENLTSHDDSQSADDKKDVKNEDKDASAKGGSLKRKRKSLSGSSTTEPPMEESGTRGSKRKKLKSTSDRFCWRCHKEGVDAHCTACPRSWHRKCIGGMPTSLEKWICGECVTILRAENAETRTLSMAQLSVDQLCMLLKHVVERLREYPGSEPFCKAVDIAEVPNYLDYVIKPMDLSLLETNVRSKLYGSTDAFMADAKWIQHNCIVFNTCGGVYADTSKLTNAAKQLIKVARQEVSEIEACPDCYAHSRNLPRHQPSWFIEPCRRPHPLVWAKLKGFPFWPAKAMPRVNSQGHVDVRFFGEHDRAWVPPKDLYLYSEEPPAPSPRKRKSDMDECVREIQRHCGKLALMFGQFKYAPSKVQYDPNDPKQILLMLPNYNSLQPNSHFPISESPSASGKKKSPLKRRSFSVNKSNKLQSDEATDNEVNTSSKENENDKQEKRSSEATAPKVQKLDVVDTKNTSNSHLNTNHSKLGNAKNRETATIAQNKNVKEEKSKSAASASRGNVASADNVAANSTTSPGSSNKTSSKLKEETKSSAESSSATSPASETSEVSRVRKRSLLKNIINPQLALSQTEKTTTRHVKNNKVYKPKTRMVDKLNAEKALKSVSASKENEKSSPILSGMTHKVLNNNKESSKGAQKTSGIDITMLPPATPASSAKILPVSTNPLSSAADKSVLFLVVNNSGKNEAAKQVATTVNKDVNSMQKETHLQKKESKARKTLHNKSHNTQIVQHLLPSTGESTATCPTKRETFSAYQLPSPEAGPISARLHHDANELARRMGQLMEEAYKEAAQANVKGENGTAENYETTVFFLQMQMEHMKWQHQQQLAELKHNNDRILFEVRKSLEAEKLRALEEARRDAEEEKVRCIEETKRKQWCANCGREAVFYCCWNTSYCDYPCQQSHWPTHMQTCCSQEAYSTVTASPGASLNQQVMPRLVLSTHHAASNVRRA
ncbi:MYND-type zinc finger-containing chromatin reader ZMYND8 isoform X2 [Linepithema humile]|uniref:MYND-type zinc finger-containing chromatin reader ZMYND8 isoform X2 n=1 Tax=Linepithema humile TaxID=83485 RepID=UPI0006234554|nr:PREDICTED: protein kinase C-binding protein 1 isoform X2 [Linepithema humile]